MDTEGGKTDNGTGQLTENSVNVTINQMDTLEKRLGFIRGLSERFGSVVCGLHTYLDNCGSEWLVVVSDEGFSIRQPFAVPVFENDDAYPFDDFTTGTTLSEETWRNTGLYIATGGALQRATGAFAQPFPAADFLRWFKDAGSLAYSVTVQYEFTASQAAQQAVSVSIKGLGDLLTGRRLQADLLYQRDGVYRARLYAAGAAGTLTEIGPQLEVAGSLTSPTGFLTLRYERSFTGPTATFTPIVEVTPTGGGLQRISAASLSELEDSELGQVSAIGASPWASILQVFGGPA